jgi:hypothetical protein
MRDEGIEAILHINVYEIEGIPHGETFVFHYRLDAEAEPPTCTAHVRIWF